MRLGLTHYVKHLLEKITQVMCKLHIRTRRELVLPTLLIKGQSHEIITVTICVFYVTSRYSPQMLNVTHRPSCPHGTTSNKATTLVWNRGLKGQSSLMILLLSLAASLHGDKA